MGEINEKQSGISNENLGQVQAWNEGSKKNCNPVVCVQHISKWLSVADTS